MRVVVVEPDANGRTSGGYLYNRRLAAQGAFTLERVAPSLPPRLDAVALGQNDLILADSLFLEPRALAPFLELRAGGARVGVLLHAFPSFIRAATHRATLSRALPLVPSASELELLSRLDVVVTPGAYVARVLAASGSRVPCAVCPPGTDPRASADPKNARSASARLLVIANLTPAKGVKDVLEALGSLREHAWHLTIVGALDADPSYVATLRDLVASHGLGERVRFRGELSHAQTLAQLGATDVLLSASYTENCPLSALEALRAGVPVVAYAAGGLVDLVEHGTSGVLAPLLDVQALAAALEPVLASAAERARLAAGAAAAGAALPTWGDAAATFQRELLTYVK